ncbi:hypothetical protein K8Z61_07800 [Nocardioides sp. TRM66260-LWL]|uniref:hypothetical protein n=1 Tax=Nocardioides sp. TRM66260-LWL TaxID=2874478 RepID=UPI001CC51ADB|nr:hypothetical protein [Nocardioides sp. TRM66260-LWL]MBZ5734398.1 hypothetical protein [Nocardioides sp. TRM66260-LWL]
MSPRRRTRLRILGATVALSTAAVAVPLLSQPGAQAAAFTGGNLVVYRVGDGSTPLTNAAAPVFLDEVSSTGAKRQSLALPVTGTAGTDTPYALTATGQGRSEGLLARSGDGRFLAVTGYDAPVGTTGPAAGDATTTSLANTDPTTVGRTVAIVGGDGAIDTTTRVLGADAPKIVRSAVTDGTNVWVTGGNGGVLATTIGGTTATRVAGDATSNLTALTVQGGQLFSGGVLADRLAAVGTGTPTAAPASGSGLTDVPGLSANLLAYGYAFADLTDQGYAGTALDTLYVADASRRGGTLDKYAFDGQSWSLAGYLDVPGISGLVADVRNGSVSLAVTTPAALQLVTDAQGAARTGFAPAAPTTLASAPTGTEFRGVALAPTGVLNPPPPPPVDYLTKGSYAWTNAKVVRKGTWKTFTASYAPGRKGLFAKTKNATLTTKVRGAAVTVTFTGGTTSGKAAVVIDGKATTIDLYRAKTGTVAKTIKVTAGVTHTVQVKVLGTRNAKSKGTAVYVGSLRIS